MPRKCIAPVRWRKDGRLGLCGIPRNEYICSLHWVASEKTKEAVAGFRLWTRLSRDEAIYGLPFLVRPYAVTPEVVHIFRVREMEMTPIEVRVSCIICRLYIKGFCLNVCVGFGCILPEGYLFARELFILLAFWTRFLSDYNNVEAAKAVQTLCQRKDIMALFALKGACLSRGTNAKHCSRNRGEHAKRKRLRYKI